MAIRVGRALGAAFAALAAAAAPGQDAPEPKLETLKDRYLIKLPPAEEPSAADPAVPNRAGRLILFLTPDNARWSAIEPADGPFFERLQPIHSIAVPAAAIRDGGTIEFDQAAAISFGAPLDTLDGRFRLQAVLDIDFTERGHLGPGNRVSEPTAIEVASDRSDDITIELTRTVPPMARRVEEASGNAHAPQLEWIERRSELLSRHHRRDMVLRAGVVLPYGYHDLDFPRRMWPTIFVIPGFGGTHLEAAAAVDALSAREAQLAVPQAVWVFLDAETPWGHHGFCDSETNGPVGRALVEEFIPFLEERFRIIARPEARLVTGHSSGGWSSLHLALTYPDTFGACFASAPDPVDFSAFQRSNLYRDPSLFVLPDGSDTPSHRMPLGPAEDRVTMTVRDELASERALDPVGRSGQQWAAWNAMWSPFDPVRNAPRPVCDAETGVVDPIVGEAWSRHDIARIFEKDPARIATLFAERVRLVCGTRDSFYLNEAVARLKAKIDAWRAAQATKGAKPPEGPGYIELLDGLTHDGAYELAQVRFHQEMRVHLKSNGLAEDPLPRGTVPGREPLPDAGSAPRRDDRPAAQPR